MRNGLLFFHRYTGLGMALFLVLVALTGSVAAFREELDRILNPALITVPIRDSAKLDAVALRERAEAIEPRALFEYFYLTIPAGESFRIVARPKTDPSTGNPYVLGYDELYLDPYTGEKIGIRNSSRALIPFLFTFHYSLALGNRGVRFLGILALVWTVTCFIGFGLTFPLRRARSKGGEHPRIPGRSWWRRWMPAWKITLGRGTYRVSYDMHRAFGLWSWLMLTVFAWSGVWLNLPSTYGAVMKFAGLRPHGFTENLTVLEKPLGTPALDWRAALETGRGLMREGALREGFSIKQEEFLMLNRYLGVYQYDVKTSKAAPGMRYADAGIFFDANTGVQRDFWSNATAPPGNVVKNWLVLLHRATVFGLPMKILNFLMGFVVTALCVTGVITWLKIGPKKRGVSALGRIRQSNPSPRMDD